MLYEKVTKYQSMAFFSPKMARFDEYWPQLNRGRIILGGVYDITGRAVMVLGVLPMMSRDRSSRYFLNQ